MKGSTNYYVISGGPDVRKLVRALFLPSRQGAHLVVFDCVWVKLQAQVDTVARVSEDFAQWEISGLIRVEDNWIRYHAVYNTKSQQGALEVFP